MPTREQVRELLGEGLDYAAAGRRLGIPAGQAYLIATGAAADGSDTIPDRDMARRDLPAASRQLASPPHENPVSKESVREWMAARIAADEQMRAARRARTAEPAGITDPDDVHDAVTVLTRQHNQVRVLLQRLEALPGHITGGSPEQMSARKSIVDMITVRLSEHETIEEEHFWPAVRRALPDGDELADGALIQEQEGKDTLTKLGRLDPDSGEFDDLAERLVLRLRKHVAYEEQVFLRIREAVPPDELDELGSRLLAGGERVPARPRRRPPKQPGDTAGDRPARRQGKAERRRGNAGR